MDELEAILETGGVAAVEMAASAMAERGKPAPPCPSCANPMIGPYCAICGQPHNTHRRSLANLVREFVKDVASFDSRILRTARALLLRPGELPNAFRSGRTQPYVPAVRLYLFVSLLFFLFLSATGIGLIQFNMTASSVRITHDAAGKVYKEVNGKRSVMEGLKALPDGTVVPEGDSAVVLPMVADGKLSKDVTTTFGFFQRPEKVARVPPAVFDEAMKDTSVNVNINGSHATGAENALSATINRLRTDPGALNGPMTAWIPRILFVLLPLFAALLALFYRRQDNLFVDHLVFSLTMHSFIFVALIGAAALAQVMSGGRVFQFFFLAVSVYFFLSLKFFYAQSWPATAIKFLGISFVYFFFFLIPALCFALVASVIWA
jgi:hypothetical protein